MYGAADGDVLLAEDAPLRPITAYAESKVRSEEGLADLDGDGFATVSMRNATVYGVVAEVAARHRPQQSRRMEPRDGPDPTP